MPKSTLGSALWWGKCPRCRQGKIFKSPATQLTQFGLMHNQCPHCGAGFEPEPGFYFGAMFISYAINVALFVAAWLALYVLWRPDSDWVYVGAITVVALVFTPWTYRFSRILWLYWFGGLRYDPTL